MRAKSCKHCSRAIPAGGALHFSNEVAIRNGYCSWMCFLAHDEKKAWKALQDYTNKRRKK